MTEKAPPENPVSAPSGVEIGHGDPFSTLRLFQKVAHGPTNLPAQLTSLIGREKELDQIRNLLLRDEIRLLTLTGTGGTGKTRLALELAGSLLNHFMDGVFLVSLAAITDPRFFLSTIVDTLGVMEQRARTIKDSLEDYLRDKRILLLLDNFEQLITAAPIVAELLGDCPQLKILVTSRAPLRVRGEHEFPVLPLQLPNLKNMPPVEKLPEYAAVALFIDRAQATKPDFALSARNARAVAEICSSLDGLPLALELAAARIRILTPDAMLNRLSSRLGLLTGGTRDLPARQQTLRGTIVWSYDLLDPQDKKLFRRLAVFVNDFSLEAAQAICNSSQDLRGDTLEVLSRLVERSLLRREYANHDLRFGMLETIREFALEALGAVDEAKAIMENHSDFFLSLAEKAEPELKGPEQVNWLSQLDREHENLRVALRYSIENKDIDHRLRFASALWRYWYIRGHLTEGRNWLAKVLAESESGKPRLRAKAFSGAGVLATWQNDFPTAQSFLRKSIAIARKLREKGEVAFALNILGSVFRNQGEFTKGRKLQLQSLKLFRELGDKWNTALVLNNLGVGARSQGDYQKAKALHQQSLRWFRELGDKRYIARSLCNLGFICERKGDYEGTRKFLMESLSLFRELGEKVGTAETLCRLGSAATRQGHHDEACNLLAESLILSREVGNNEEIAEGLEQFASCACSQGKAEHAARLLAAAQALRKNLHFPIPPAYRADHKRDVATVRSTLGNSRFAAEWARGQAITIEQAIAYALSAVTAHQHEATLH